MLKLLGAIVALAALVGGCGSSDPAPSAATPEPTPTPTPTAAPEVEKHVFERGHSKAVREYYRHSPGHAHDNVEAEYHQPPKPATGGIGDTITLTGINIGVRARVRLVGLVDPVTASRPPKPGTRFVGAELQLRTTGITILEDVLDNAQLSYRGGRARAVTRVKAECSNGFQKLVRIDVARNKRGCVVFEVPAGKRPRQFQLALEQVPAEAGGRWVLR
jgi:hypothetical protein